MTKKNIYLFHGHDNYSAQQKLNHWRKEFEKKYGDLNLQIFDGEDFTAAQFSEAIATVPFLSEKKLIIIRDFLRDGGEEEQKTVAEKLGSKQKRVAEKPADEQASATGKPEAEESAGIPDHCVIVFIEHEKPDARTTLFKKLTKIGQAVEFEDMEKPQLVQWIRQEFDKKNTGASSGAAAGAEAAGAEAAGAEAAGAGAGAGASNPSARANDTSAHTVRIGTREAELLADTVGPNLWQLSHEIEKLSLYGQENPIDEKAIESLTSPNLSSSIFKLTDYLAQKNSRLSLKTLNTLILSGEDLFQIFFMIVRHFRILIEIKACLEKKLDRPQIIQKTREHPYAVMTGMTQCKNFSAEKLAVIYRHLLKIDIDTKSGRIRTTTGDNSELRLSLEKLMVELCA